VQVCHPNNFFTAAILDFIFHKKKNTSMWKRISLCLYCKWHG